MRRCSGWRTFSLSSREAVTARLAELNQGRIQRGRRVDNRRAAPLFSAIAVALPRLRFRSGIDNGGPFTDVGATHEVPGTGIQTKTLSTPRAPGDESWAWPARGWPAGPVERLRGGQAPGAPRGPRALVTPARRRTDVDFPEPAAE
jgi:hypothetical protein